MRPSPPPNVFIAYSHYLNGKRHQATRCVQALVQYFRNHAHRFEDIVQGRADPGDPMQRPQVRFDGERLAEVTERWPHAQNDSVGYFLWLYATLACGGELHPTSEDLRLLQMVVEYLKAIAFWEDEDSGHWKEVRKISASSIGMVVGGLQALKKLFVQRSFGVTLLEELIGRGHAALEQILPSECIQDDPRKRRDHDAALLFLVFPVKVVNERLADQILGNVIANLQGDFGIRRYRGDSYWCADYKDFLGPQERASDFSERIESRNRFLREGEEVQWCVFDPIISAVYGERFRTTGHPEDLYTQTEYLNRSLNQFTEPNSAFGAFKCPEAYYLEDGHYVPNDNTPLLWAQANLWIALKMMEDNLTL